MHDRSASQHHKCRYCRTSLPPSWARLECPACGARLTPEIRGSAFGHLPDRTRLQERLTALNEELVDAGARNAEDAFSLGCWMSASIVVVSGILTFLLSGRDLITTVVVVTGLLLAATILATYLSVKAKSGAMLRAYQDVISPQVDDLQAAYQMDREEFLALAQQDLPEDMPLRAYLASPDRQVAISQTTETGVKG